MLKTSYVYINIKSKKSLVPVWYQSIRVASLKAENPFTFTGSKSDDQVLEVEGVE